MENLKDIFFCFLGRLKDFGKLGIVHYYGDIATIELEKDGKKYTFSMRCEEKTDGNN